MCTWDPGLEEVLEFEKKRKSARIKTKGLKN
jgi:hypothetical protein